VTYSENYFELIAVCEGTDYAIRIFMRIWVVAGLWSWRFMGEVRVRLRKSNL